MSLLRHFYQNPVYEPHVQNTLLCPEEYLHRLRDESAIQLRRYREEALRDRILRYHMGEDVSELASRLTDRCTELRARVGLVSETLSGHASGGEFGDLVVSAYRDDDGGAARASEAPTSRPTADDRPSGQGAGPSSETRADRNGRFGIAQCDPEIRFQSDFRGELIATLYSESQHWTFSLGVWYYRLKRTLYGYPSWRRIYKISNVDGFNVSQELLMGVINAVENVTVCPTYDCLVSDLEAAACLLAAYYAVRVVRRSDSSTPDAALESVSAVLRNSGRVLKVLLEDMTAEAEDRGGGGRLAANRYGYRDPSGMRYYIPLKGGKRYATGTFDQHAVVRVMLKHGVLTRLPGSRDADMDYVVSEMAFGKTPHDPLFTWSSRLLRDLLGTERVPVLTGEQQYLRSGLTCIMGMLLMFQTSNLQSVFGGREGHFNFTDVLRSDFPASSASTSGSVGEPGYVPNVVRNYEYLMEAYVVRWYRRDRNVTFSQLFPGLVLACAADSVRSGWVHGSGDDDELSSASSGDNVTTLLRNARSNPVVEFMFAQHEGKHRLGDDPKRLEAHDALLFHYENGLGRVLSNPLPGQFVLGLMSSLFGVGNVYDYLYFTALGFLPVVQVS
uniref:GP77 n=1 Tax=Caviid herpesvirus 2 str. CIDMTR TaxID=1415526 RepID=U6HC38_9BETA|nr:GP77 [Caviid herpesvirus 2 str. CIDMTR]